MPQRIMEDSKSLKSYVCRIPQRVNVYLKRLGF